MGWLQRIGQRFTRRESRSVPVLLYTRSDCCLCEEAKKLLEKYRGPFGLEIREVDIDSDPQLKEKYDHCVPVVEIDGVERFRGKISEVLLRRLLP